MSYLGNQPTNAAFVTDQFSGNGATTTFNMSVAPATTSSILVSVGAALQGPDAYSVNGTTLTFSAAPPAGTTVYVRYLGIPASGVTTTAYRTVTEFTATAGQKTFSVPSYTVGYIDVYRNGARLGAADFTATTGTTVVLVNACSAGDLVVTESFYVSSVLNAIPATANSVLPYIGTRALNTSQVPAGSVLQVVQGTYSSAVTISTSTWTALGLTASITPTSATSKVLVMVSLASCGKANVNTQFNAYIYKNGSALVAIEGSGGYTATTATNYFGSVASNYLDSPATTSSTTYAIYLRSSSNTNGIVVNDGSPVPTSTITLVEIAA